MHYQTANPKPTYSPSPVRSGTRFAPQGKRSWSMGAAIAPLVAGFGRNLGNSLRPASAAALVVASLGLGLGLGVAHPSLAAEWATIQARRRIIIGVKDNVRPLGFRDDQGQLQGFEIDLARRMGQDLLGTPEAVELRPLSHRDRIPALLSDRVDLVIAQLTDTPDRRRVIQFSRPYYWEATRLIRSSDGPQALGAGNPRAISHPATNRPALTPAIGVLQNSSTEAQWTYHYPHIPLQRFRSYADARAALTQGHVVAVAADQSILAGWLQLNPTWQWLGDPLQRYPIAIALPKGLAYEPLRQRLDATLTHLLQTGWLSDRTQAWGLPSPLRP